MKFLIPSFPVPAYKTARTNGTTLPQEGGRQDGASLECASISGVVPAAPSSLSDHIWEFKHSRLTAFCLWCWVKGNC